MTKALNLRIDDKSKVWFNLPDEKIPFDHGIPHDVAVNWPDIAEEVRAAYFEFIDAKDVDGVEKLLAKENFDKVYEQRTGKTFRKKAR